MYNIESIATAARRLKAFADVAGDYGITPGLEFNGFSDVKDIATAVAIVREAGCGAVALDVLHLMRNVADIAAVAPNAGLTGDVQVSDGQLEMPDEITAWHEAVKEQIEPGDGSIPLAENIDQVRGNETTGD